MDAWEKAKVVIGAVATVVIPLVIAYTGNTFSGAIKEREVRSKYVELAVSILRADKESSPDSLREWATQIIDQYSGIAMSDAAKSSLVHDKPLPTTSAPSTFTISAIPQDQVNNLRDSLEREGAFVKVTPSGTGRSDIEAVWPGVRYDTFDRRLPN